MRLPITDHALTCATGPTTTEALDAIFACRAGLSSRENLLVGAVKAQLDPVPEDFEAFDTRQARLALHTTQQIAGSIDAAIARWGSDRVAVLVGTSTGGIRWTESVYEPGTRHDQASLSGGVFHRHAFGAVADLLKQVYALTGPGYCLSTACSSSAHIFGSARRLIESGVVDAALAIGVDTLCELTLRGFGGLGLLSAGQCRPFDKSRDGINIGEAGAVVLIERAHDDAEFALAGFGSSSDGFHMTRPPDDGAGAVMSMRAALATAQIQGDQVAAINAHGTGTVANDAAEAAAISAVFGQQACVASTKGYTGHTLGACGAVEAVISIESLRRQQLPATFGLRESDDALAVRASAQPQEFDGDYVLSNSFAFGGNNATVVLQRL